MGDETSKSRNGLAVMGGQSKGWQAWRNTSSMAEFGTTPFEDLILGSQFLPALATLDREDGEPRVRVGVLQCRRCAACFLQVREALSHYRLHVFETHKEHFTVVAGGTCPLPGCPFAAKELPTIHFHCAYCCFTSTEIMDLPLHMEKRHLAFYREVSLVLRGDDVQRTKVYTCGECGSKIQGTVSIVQHLLAHDTTNTSTNSQRPTPHSTTTTTTTTTTQPSSTITTNTVLLNGAGGDHNGVEIGVSGVGMNDQLTAPLVNGVAGKTEAGATTGENNKVPTDPKMVNGTEDIGAGQRLGADILTDGTEVKFSKNLNLSSILSGLDGAKIRFSPRVVPSTIPGLVAIPVLMEGQTAATGTTAGILNGIGTGDIVGLDGIMGARMDDRSNNVNNNNTNNNNVNINVGNNILSLQEEEESLQVEINPLDLLTTVMEEDGRSDQPIFPPEHFLLSLPTPTPHFLEGAGMIGGGGVTGVGAGDGGIGGGEEGADGGQTDHHTGGGTRGEDEDEGEDGEGPPGDILLDHPGIHHCDKCEETFKYQHRLVLHKLQVHQATDPVYECQVCGAEYSSVGELRRHVSTHTGPGVITCGVCSLGFPDRASLKVHSLSHGGGPERSNKCESCGSEFPSKSELTRHIVKYQGTCNPNKNEGVRCATCGEGSGNTGGPEGTPPHRPPYTRPATTRSKERL
ncbi:hypothetical protein Pcinc_037211 [Petrolisthes cinctipes]|uniref:C2H2-type domain-containing protein n=1 Tax=Petrolisthes cinctipes TaxID=88211 RepID=A0AAE1BU12_PETCI|nr:hypothetical protein Pcinc_037211 [Petrolisthes cinctipes]